MNNKVAIITGAATGIGFEIAKKLVEAGGKVILNDIDEHKAEKAAEKIDLREENCQFVAGDCSDQDVIEKLIASAIASFGKLDIAIANAGVTHFGNFLDYAPEMFNHILKTNLNGSFFIAQAAAKQMIKQGHGGSLLFTTSVTGIRAPKDLAAYGMTKAALISLARNLVADLSPFGININTIAPGATLTERTLEDPSYVEKWSALTPMGRAANPADIADAALFLVSDKARHITGQTLAVDGGWTSISFTGS